jgi:hypothetical protein
VKEENDLTHLYVPHVRRKLGPQGWDCAGVEHKMKPPSWGPTLTGKVEALRLTPTRRAILERQIIICLACTVLCTSYKLRHVQQMNRKRIFPSYSSARPIAPPPVHRRSAPRCQAPPPTVVSAAPRHALAPQGEQGRSARRHQARGPSPAPLLRPDLVAGPSALCPLLRAMR